MYSIPDEISSFAEFSLNSHVIQCLNKHYGQYNFKHIPKTLITIITTYTNELFGCIDEFETKYRKLIHQVTSKINSLLLKVFLEAYDKDDNDCLYGFLIPRAKHGLNHNDDDGEAFENYHDAVYIPELFNEESAYEPIPSGIEYGMFCLHQFTLLYCIH